ncbi:hypothetical protein [Clostridium saccharobutylicum]|uniref:Uncharacterized protein n=1 Tax=Clostridium saccharobutylicum TaxID=169679 RepID=A0A1S8MY54_CLOSA|nr:hypothetical protein [Clostridium saccharobutylicum]OOM09139.1 hypothetical protein CLOSAC_34190 [Clostridium saccharobutylicum]
MESIENTSYMTNLNIEAFSKMIGEEWNISSCTFKDYILANISIAITRNIELKRNINKIYDQNRIKYNNAAINSSCINHVLLTDGTLEQEIAARKALGILLSAENDHILRDIIVNLLRKSYPTIFNAVKKHDKRELVKRYLKMDEITQKTESRLDACIYFYFSIYRSKEIVDQGFVISIIEDMKYFEFCDPITRIIDKEIELHKSEIQELKALLKREYGKLNGYKDILKSDLKPIMEYGEILENMFIINKLDINHLFCNSNFLNIDAIILSYLKRNSRQVDIKLLLQTVISGIFIQTLINEYKNSRNLYFNNNQETLFSEINTLEEKLSKADDEKIELLNKIKLLEEKNNYLDKIVNTQTKTINKMHNFEINKLQNRIEELENQLLSEKNYRNELNELREHLFKINSNYIASTSKKTLDYYIARKNIIIIGGTKDWRRRFREKYPQLRTLTGFNGNFDPNILFNYDYVFFYTGYMDHATYYRAINFIRSHNIKFGYIGKTNIELVEDELIDELQKLN